jgi:protease-4
VNRSGFRPAAALAALALLWTAACLPAHARADTSLRPYPLSADLLATTPSTDDGAIGALYNPAQWGVLDRPEFSFFWSDANVRADRLDNWGISAGQGLGFSVRRVEESGPAGPRRVTDYQIGLGFGSGEHFGGMALGFSGAGKSEFGRASFLTLGEIWRPARWLSYGTATQLALGDDDIQSVADIGIRPLSDPRLLLFADYALRRRERWDGGALAGGVAVRPIAGLFASARWGKADRVQITLGATLGRAGLRATPGYDRDGNRGATQYVLRNSAPVRGFDGDGRLNRGRRTLALDLHGDAVYQSHVLFDRGALPLREILEPLQFAIDDPTVGAVVVNLSGFEANIEMTWEVREKLLAVRRAGKRVYAVCDNLDARTYYLAAAADRIMHDPRGSFLLPGVQLSRTYLRDLLSKVGLGFDEWRYYKYKSALEAFSRDRMSDADREQWTSIVRAAYEEVRGGIVASGRTTAEEFDRVVNEEPYLSPKRLLELKWVDRLGRWEDLEKWVREDGRRSKPASYASLKERRWRPDEAWGPIPTIGLVYLVGECAMDDGIRARASSKAIRSYREARGVKALVLRVDSPGGDPLASDVVAGETRRAREAKKPVLVSQGRVAGSGGYWISMDADQIAASPFTVTGSIGVTGGWVWNDGIGKKLGLTSDHVRIGRSADLLGGLKLPLFGATIPERNLDPGERRLIERAFGELYDDFTGKVAAARRMDVARVREIAEGRVYGGRAAAELGLIDRIGTLDETIEEAKRRAGIRPGDRVRIVEHPKRPFLRLPAFLRGALGGARGDLSAAAEGAPYEVRALQSILDQPGRPLLMTPGPLLPAETEAVR